MNATFFRITTTSLALIFFAISGVATAQTDAATDDGPAGHLLYTPDAVEWLDGPPSFEAGAQFAVLEGNPGEPGVFTLRLKLPDGFAIAPHWHPVQERVTVISGTLLLGHGDTLNRETTDRFGVGSYVSLAPEMVHYAIAEGETVLQLTSVGPWELNYVNPADDPRK